MRMRNVEILVGLFIIAGLAGLILLAFEVSGFTNIDDRNSYVLMAEFDNVGSLKVRAPVAVGGVTIGRISDIALDDETFKARVTMLINRKDNTLPTDTSASILTQGLLGSNYVSLIPGFSSDVLRPGDKIETTRSALILEDLIGQLMFKLTGDESDKDSDTATSKPAVNDSNDIQPTVKTNKESS
ncbi:MAG TPA: outer membrane lipid asymmetry maintenance protein MlaD [Coxiellaceae bacterium]|nr:outer membrane lipid asymmetry maintenance protein MlaD [Coxiellaceae bacterium]